LRDLRNLISMGASKRRDGSKERCKENRQLTRKAVTSEKGREGEGHIRVEVERLLVDDTLLSEVEYTVERLRMRERAEVDQPKDRPLEFVHGCRTRPTTRKGVRTTVRRLEPIKRRMCREFRRTSGQLISLPFPPQRSLKDGLRIFSVVCSPLFLVYHVHILRLPNVIVSFILRLAPATIPSSAVLNRLVGIKLGHHCRLPRNSECGGASLGFLRGGRGRRGRGCRSLGGLGGKGRRESGGGRGGGDGLAVENVVDVAVAARRIRGK
jgi:hypothetical protein